MLQVFQDLSAGDVKLETVPAPSLRQGHLLIQTTRSLVSPGTERMLRDFGRANLVQKALQQPQRVKEVLNKARTDGIFTTIEAVRSKLDQPIALGYCNVGRVLALASDVSGFRVGDRVVSNGAHAQTVRASKNLCVRIPDSVSDDTASFAVLGSIALEGIRLADLQLGACAAVVGLGLVGLLAVQLLRAQGVRVLGIDLDADRCALAKKMGAETICPALGEDVIARARDFSRGRGVDAVLICAATSSNEPIEQSAKITRQRGCVVLVGVVGLDLPRDEFYQKELLFRVSCSYGPGRYDPNYEENGQDYPAGFVRWTAQRNIEAVLDAMAAGQIDISGLLSCRFPIDQAAQAYERLDDGGKTLGIILDYPDQSIVSDGPLIFPAPQVALASSPDAVRVGVIGAGNYAARMLIPAVVAAGGVPTAICASSGNTISSVARKFAFRRISSDNSEVMDARDVDLVIVATRHDSHASLVISALEAGKPVFVEKPLAITQEQLDALRSVYTKAPNPFVMVGFNRRFSPFTREIKQALEETKSIPAIAITVNAGAIPSAHWTQRRDVGGGRLIGENCHFIDLARFLAGAPITEAHAVALGGARSREYPEENSTTILKFANGATAAIQYLANGEKSYPKERVEVFADGKIWRIDNFRRLEGFGVRGSRQSFLGAQKKGQVEMMEATLSAVGSGQPAPIPFEELLEVSATAIALDQHLRVSK